MLERKEGTRIVYYKSGNEKAAILEELKRQGFKCSSNSINLNTSTESEIEWYIHDMPIAIDFEYRTFTSTGVTVALHGWALGIGTAELLEILRTNRHVEPHSSIRIV